MQKKEQVTIHIDATGSVVHRPPSAQKRILYYAGAVKVNDDSPIIPILEMISSQHDVFAIGMWLVSFSAYRAAVTVALDLLSSLVPTWLFV